MSPADLSRSTALRLLVSHTRTKPTAVAFRSKHLGLYRERTWRDYAVLVARAALRPADARPGSRANASPSWADACEEWLIADLAAQSLGAIVYGIYPTASAEEVEYQMRDGGAAVFVAEDQEYVDKILPFADRLPALRCIVVVDDHGDVRATRMPSSAPMRRCATAGERRRDLGLAGGARRAR